MFHYLLASLRRADGENCVTSTGAKTFNVFAGLGEHRYVLLILTYIISHLIFLLRFALSASAPIYGWWYYFLFTSVLANPWDNTCLGSLLPTMKKSTSYWRWKFACKYLHYLFYLLYLASLHFLLNLFHLQPQEWSQKEKASNWTGTAGGDQNKKGQYEEGWKLDVYIYICFIKTGTNDGLRSSS